MDTVVKAYECANENCNAKIGLSGESMAAIEARLGDLGWKQINGQWYCPKCASDYETAQHQMEGFIGQF